MKIEQIIYDETKKRLEIMESSKYSFPLIINGMGSTWIPSFFASICVIPLFESVIMATFGIIFPP